MNYSFSPRTRRGTVSLVFVFGLSIPAAAQTSGFATPPPPPPSLSTTQLCQMDCLHDFGACAHAIPPEQRVSAAQQGGAESAAVAACHAQERQCMSTCNAAISQASPTTAAGTK